jgi:hypothetical protein
METNYLDFRIVRDGTSAGIKRLNSNFPYSILGFFHRMGVSIPFVLRRDE